MKKFIILIISFCSTCSLAQTFVGGSLHYIISNITFKAKPNTFAILARFEPKNGFGISGSVQKYLSKKLSLKFRCSVC